MARIVVMNTGYRLRDLVAGLVVIQIALAFVYALLTDSTGAAIKVPAAVFAVGLMLVAIAFSGGYMVDKITARYPSLIRPRRCPRIVLIGLPIAALALALQDERVLGMLSSVYETASTDGLNWLFT